MFIYENCHFGFVFCLLKMFDVNETFEVSGLDRNQHTGGMAVQSLFKSAVYFSTVVYVVTLHQKTM